MNDQEVKPNTSATMEFVTEGDGLGVPEFLRRERQVKAEENIGKAAPTETQKKEERRPL